MRQTIPGQVLVSHQRAKMIKRFKVIEVTGESEAQVHLNFLLPASGDEQFLYLNSKMDRIIEVVSNFVTYIYKVVRLSGADCKLELIRRMDDFPREFIPTNPDIYHREKVPFVRSELTFFSPDFSQFLYSNSNKGTFQIKDTYTN